MSNSSPTRLPLALPARNSNSPCLRAELLDLQLQREDARVLLLEQRQGARRALLELRALLRAAQSARVSTKMGAVGRGVGRCRELAAVINETQPCAASTERRMPSVRAAPGGPKSLIVPQAHPADRRSTQCFSRRACLAAWASAAPSAARAPRGSSAASVHSRHRIAPWYA